MESQYFAIQRIEHSAVFFHLFNGYLFDAFGEQGVIWRPTAWCAAEDIKDLAFTTRNHDMLICDLALVAHRSRLSTLFLQQSKTAIKYTFLFSEAR